MRGLFLSCLLHEATPVTSVVFSRGASRCTVVKSCYFATAHCRVRKPSTVLNPDKTSLLKRTN